VSFLEIPSEFERLKRRLTGHWTLQAARIMPDKTVTRGTGTFDISELPGGYALLGTYRVRMEGQEPHEEQELWGFDSGTRRIRLFCVTARSSVIEFSGVWEDDTTMKIQGTGNLEGMEVTRELVFSWKSPDKIHARQAFIGEGVTGPVTEFLMERKN
jgi:hypothetical protein